MRFDHEHSGRHWHVVGMRGRMGEHVTAALVDRSATPSRGGLKRRENLMTDDRLGPGKSSRNFVLAEEQIAMMVDERRVCCPTYRERRGV
jgi:hypothetical protein